MGGCFLTTEFAGPVHYTELYQSILALRKKTIDVIIIGAKSNLEVLSLSLFASINPEKPTTPQVPADIHIQFGIGLFFGVPQPINPPDTFWLYLLSWCITLDGIGIGSALDDKQQSKKEIINTLITFGRAMMLVNKNETYSLIEISKFTEFPF